MKETQRQLGRSLQTRIRFVVCSVLAILSLVLMATSLISFETIRGFLDRLSGDGSADPFTPALHAKFILSLRILGLFGGLLAILVGLVPVQSWLNFLNKLELKKRIQSSIFWWRVICHGQISAGQIKWLGGITLFAVMLRLPYLNDPIRYDEAHTYLSYAKYPWFVIISVYNDPNNHIFHTLLVRLSTSLFGNAEWAIRLPAFLAGIVLVPLTFLTCRAIAGRQGAIAAGSIVAVSSALIEYSVIGRGYTLICCFTMLNLLCALRISHGQRGLEWGLMTLSSALGMWTVPIMVYPNLIIWGWLLLRKMFHTNPRESMRAILLNWIFWVVVTCLLTTLLYLPVILTTGLKSLSGQDFAQSLTASEYFAKLFSISDVQRSLLLRDWSLISLGGLAFYFLVGIRDGIKTDWQRCLAGIVAVAGCLIFIFWQRVIPPARVGLFAIPLLSLPIGLGFATRYRSLTKVKKRLIWSVWLIFMVCVPVTNQSLRNSIRLSRETGICPEAEEAVQLLEAEDWFQKNASVPLIAVSPTSAPIVYYAERSGMSLQHFNVPDESSLQEAVVIVSHINDQSVEEVLGQLELTDSHIAERFQRWKRLQTISLYRFEK